MLIFYQGSTDRESDAPSKGHVGLERRSKLKHDDGKFVLEKETQVELSYLSRNFEYFKNKNMTTNKYFDYLDFYRVLRYRLSLGQDYFQFLSQHL